MQSSTGGGVATQKTNPIRTRCCLPAYTHGMVGNTKSISTHACSTAYIIGLIQLVSIGSGKLWPSGGGADPGL